MALTNLRCEDGPGGTRTITPEGDLDSNGVGAIRDLLGTALATGVKRTIVDLSRTGYIDTSAIAMLMEASVRAAHARARVLVVSPPGSRASTIFRLTGADEAMPVLDSRQEALSAA